MNRTPTPTTDSVVVDVRGRTHWLRLNRPQAMNALNDDLLSELHDALATAEADPSCRSVVITGGDRFFCAGADLDHVRSRLSEDGPEGLRQFLTTTGKVLGAIDNFPKPVIAAVDGLAMGGGLELLLCCDLVIATTRAALADAHATYGLLPGGGASVRLVRRLGLTRARELMYTGRPQAADLFVGSLVTQVVDAGELDTSVTELTELLNERSPLGLRRMKELSAKAEDRPLAECLADELQQAVEHAASDDFAEGLAAFAEKRKPAFTGT